jgi:hypothetical protein
MVGIQKFGIEAVGIREVGIQKVGIRRIVQNLNQKSFDDSKGASDKRQNYRRFSSVGKISPLDNSSNYC